jgi:hypothetical protein
MELDSAPAAIRSLQGPVAAANVPAKQMSAWTSAPQMQSVTLKFAAQCVVWMQSTICLHSAPFDTPGIGLVALVTPVKLLQEFSELGQLRLPPWGCVSQLSTMGQSLSFNPFTQTLGQQWSPFVQVVIG